MNHPFQIGQRVRHFREPWTGTVTAIRHDPIERNSRAIGPYISTEPAVTVRFDAGDEYNYWAWAWRPTDEDDGR